MIPNVEIRFSPNSKSIWALELLSSNMEELKKDGSTDRKNNNGVLMYDYVEHIAEIPVEASLLPECLEPRANDPFWGLKIPSVHPMKANSKIELRFALGSRTIGAVGQVVRCVPHTDGYVVWVRFASFVDCHRARLGEQACQMESWIRSQERLGTLINREQAEQEWLAKFAAQFPAITLAEAA